MLVPILYRLAIHIYEVEMA